MILIPQKLFEQPEVKTILRDGLVCILKKELNKPVVEREGYISNHVISVVLAGEQKIKTYDEEILKVKAGEVLFIPRGMYYVTDLLPKNGQFKSLLFYFDDAIIQEFLSTSKVTDISKEKAPSHLKFQQVPAVQLFGESLLQIYDNQGVNLKNVLSLKILELLYLLNGLAGKQTFANFLFKLTLPKKRNIKNFMQQNFDKPLKVEDYAYLTGRSVSTFRRDFKSSFDITPQKWLKEQRIEKALKILNEKEISVTQLAYEVGYENISYFIKEFKNSVGLSPKQFMLSQNRNQLRN